MSHQTMTSRSKNAIEQIRKLLLNIDLEIERIQGEIDLRTERMGFYSSSSKKSYQKAFLLAKVEKENYEVFLNRVMNLKTNIKKRVASVCNKYEGDYSKVFELFFFEKKDYAEIETKTGLSRKQLYQLIHRMRHDIIDFDL